VSDGLLLALFALSGLVSLLFSWLLVSGSSGSARGSA